MSDGRHGGHTAGDTSFDDLYDEVAAVLGLCTTPPGGGVSPEDHEFDQDANLFSLGLESLTLIHLMTSWRRRGAEVTFEQLAEIPTLRHWNRLLTAARPAADPAVALPATATATGPGPATSSAASGFELATMQHAYWIGRHPGQPFGGVAAHFYAELDGAGVEPERLRGALARLLARHGMLRARFTPDGRCQLAPPPDAVTLPVRDLSRLPAEQITRTLDELREHYTHRMMDIEAGQVLEVALTLLPDDATRLHIDLDMTVADALSLRILLEDLRRAYEDPHDDSDPAIAYDYPRYLRERRAHDATRREQARVWWGDRLADLPGAPELPRRADAGRPGLPARSIRLAHHLDAEDRDRLTRRARRHGVTPSAALAAVFAEVIGAWSRTPRFLLNLPLFDRAPLHPEVDRLVGDFSSSILVDVDVSSALPFVEQVRRLQAKTAAAIDRGTYSGVEVLRDLSRHTGSAVLAPVVYTSAIGLGDIYTTAVQRCFGRPVWIISQGPQVWLDAQVTEHDGGLLLNWDVRLDVLAPGTAQDAFDAYRRLIDELVDDDGSWDRPVGTLLPPAAAATRARANATAVDRPARTLHHPVLARAAAQPDRPAIIDGARRTSYGELAAAATAVARLLVGQGVRPGDTVVVTLPRGTGQIIAVLGVLAAGAAYLPVGTGQPVLRRERIHARSGASFALTDDEHLPVVTAAGGPRPLLLREALCQPTPSGSAPDAVPLAGPAPDLDPAPGAGAEAGSIPVPVSPDSLAYVLFTSGSTGEPKGVEMSHAAAANTIDALNARLDVGPDDRVLTVSALEFDLSVYDVFGLLSAGGTVVCVPEEQQRDAAAWWHAVTSHGVTIWNTVPALLDMLLTAAEHADTAEHTHATGREKGAGGPLPRVVLLGGDRIPPDLPRRLRARVPGSRFVALGGMTEAAIHSTWFEVPPEADDEAAGWPSMPWGAPLDNVRARVVDSRGRDRPDQVPGELWIGGAGLARGYRGDPDRTVDRFVAHHDGVRYYRTGDLAFYRPDGTLEHAGRADHQVKIRGHRIELGEIEAAATTHPAVGRAAAVIARAAAGPAIALVVSPAEGEETAALRRLVDNGALAGWLADRLPEPMRADQVLVRPALPLSANGKIDRVALGAAAAGALGRRHDGRSDGPVDEPPRGPVEQRLARMWAELLGVATVGRSDGFFTLGGDSLLATRMVGRLTSAGLAGGRIGDLFAHPALAGFAARLRLDPDADPDPDRAGNEGTGHGGKAGLTGAPDGTPAASPGHPVTHPAGRQPARTGPGLVADPERRHEPFPPTEVQRAYWIGRDERLPLGGVGTWHYTEFDAPAADVDLGRLARAWDLLVTRHEMLRAVFDEDGRQRILRSVPPVHIEVVDAGPANEDAGTVDAETVTADAETGTADALARFRAERAHRRHDLGRWPLFDISALRYRSGGESRVRLAIGLDYIVFDALSIMTLYTELDRLHRAPEGADPVLAPIGVSFRDYVLQIQPDRQEAEADQAYWARRVADLPPAPRLPTAVDPTTVSAGRFTRLQHWLEPRRWNRLRDGARGHGLTPSTVLLAAYAEVLGTWNDTPDLTVTLTLFNRRDVHPDIHRVIGDFTTVALADYRPTEAGGFLAAAADLQRRLGADLDHRDVSPTWLLRQLARAAGGIAATPVVFTSAIGVGDGDVSMDLSAAFPTAVYGLSTSPQVCLDNQVLPARGGLQVSWDFVDGLLRPGLVEAMFDAYRRLLDRLTEDDWGGPLPDLRPVAQREVRDRANATAVALPRQTLHARVFDVAARSPGRIALVWEDGGHARSMTYGELRDAALRTGAALVARGVRPGDPVAVTLPKGPGQIVAVLGVLAAGACYVPVGVEQPPARRARIWRDAGVRLVLCGPTPDRGPTPGHGLASGRAADSDHGATVHPGCRLLLLDEARVTANPLPGPVDVDPDEVAYVIFTSGSTGTPKGVEITHDAAANTVVDIVNRCGLRADDRVLALSALDFDLSVFDVFGLLGVGGALVLPAEDERRDAARWLALARTHGVTVWNTVPTLLEMLLVAAESDGLPLGLRCALVSGDWVGLDLADRLAAGTGTGGRCRLIALGGATEASIWSNAFEPTGTGGLEDEPAPGWQSVPYGFPLANQRYRVVDGLGRDRPDWAPGELWIGGRGVARGYRGDPERTAERFVTHAGDRWYRTGDLGRYRPDGTLEFLGRLDHQVKIGGHRIELAEIDAALEAFPGTGRAVTVAVGPPGRRSLHAFLERGNAGPPGGDDTGQPCGGDTGPVSGETETAGRGAARPVAGTDREAAVRAFLAERLPAYAIPPRLTLVEALPLTANGKIDRAVLFQTGEDARHAGAAPPAGPVEEAVADIWRDLLGAEVTDREANFFGLGGDSVLALRLVARLRTRFGVELPIRRFLSAPTVARLGAELADLGIGAEDDVEEGVL
ncbi:amino acid adenylation domain-containing protein [Parafrankia sp. FMc6]|uniref:amino acid adenylation domain-containing protein n=1 Tax=Parafrankia soli TaxID=2599596 RepID=UPI0034D53C38